MEKGSKSGSPSIGDLVACYILNTSMPEPELLDVGLVLDVNCLDHQILVQSLIMHKRYWWSDKIWKVLSRK